MKVTFGNTDTQVQPKEETKQAPIVNPAIYNNALVKNTYRVIPRAAETVLAGFGIPDFYNTMVGLGKKASPYLEMPDSMATSRLPGIESLPEAPEWMTSEGMKKNVTKPLEKKFLPKDYGKGTGAISDIIDSFGRSLPLVGLSLPAVLSSLGASAGMKGAEKLGFGVPGQIAGSFFGGNIGNLLKATPTMLRKFGKSVESPLWDNARKIADTPNFQVSSRSTLKEIDKVLESAKKGLSSSTYKALYNELSEIGKGSFNGKFDVKDLIKFRKKLGYAMGDVRKISSGQIKTYQKFIGDIKDKISEGLDTAGKMKPSFGKAYNAALSTSRALNAPSLLSEMFSKNKTLQGLAKNKVTKLLLGAGAGGAGGASVFKLGALPSVAIGAGMAGAGVILNQFNTGFNLIAKSPVIREHLKQIGKDVVNNNIKRLKANIIRLDRVVTKETIQKLSSMGVTFG